MCVNCEVSYPWIVDSTCILDCIQHSYIQFILKFENNSLDRWLLESNISIGCFIVDSLTLYICLKIVNLYSEKWIGDHIIMLYNLLCMDFGYNLSCINLFYNL